LPIPIVERSQEEIARIIKNRVERIKHVASCDKVSVRMIRKRFDVNIDISLDISLDSKLEFERIHRIISNVERTVKKVIPNVRVTVETRTFASALEEVWRLVREVAERMPGSRGVHNIHVQMASGKICVDFHLEVAAGMTLKQAHDVSDQVERELRAANPSIGDITIHMESALDFISRERTGAGTAVKWYIEDLAKRFPEIKDVHGVRVRKVGDTLHVVLRCLFDPNINVKEAHEISNKLENAIKSAYPNIAKIDIHEEPA
jgi:divalent metal cation (Fe/Co/Zn/Cd) transporter